MLLFVLSVVCAEPVVISPADALGYAITIPNNHTQGSTTLSVMATRNNLIPYQSVVVKELGNGYSSIYSPYFKYTFSFRTQEKANVLTWSTNSNRPEDKFQLVFVGTHFMGHKVYKIKMSNGECATYEKDTIRGRKCAEPDGLEGRNQQFIMIPTNKAPQVAQKRKKSEKKNALGPLDEYYKYMDKRDEKRLENIKKKTNYLQKPKKKKGRGRRQR